MSKYKLIFSIAFKYLLSKKSFAIINIISAISMLGVAIGTMALFVVLSVFNGFESIILDLSNNIHSDFKIVPKKHKTFNINDFPLEKIQKMPEVKAISEVIEDMALARYGDFQHVVNVKAVGESFIQAANFSEIVVYGEPKIKENDLYFVNLGVGVDMALKVNFNDFSRFVSLYAPRRTAKPTAPMQQAFVSESTFPASVFSVQQEYDESFVIVHLNVAKRLYEYENERTSVEIFLKNNANYKSFERKLNQLLSDEYLVKNRYQQQEFIYKILKSEKLAIFIILSFIILIATFNVIGTLSMIIIEKKKDIAILNALGLNIKTLKLLFITQGLLIVMLGALIGLFLGYILVFLQQTFGLLSLGTGSGDFIVQYYPVLINHVDIALILGIVFLIGLVAAIIPSQKINSNYANLKDVQEE